ncbi:MAG: hypothetical protein EOM62_16975, partial [Bacteroidia bacterium]|nr:hypothetical protein [Bacteroidia bacterium]
MNIEQVQAIINNGEGPQTEFKATFRSLIEEVCAFSNAEGGLILIPQLLIPTPKILSFAIFRAAIARLILEILEDSGACSVELIPI